MCESANNGHPSPPTSTYLCVTLKFDTASLQSSVNVSWCFLDGEPASILAVYAAKIMSACVVHIHRRFAAYVHSHISCLYKF